MTVRSVTTIFEFNKSVNSEMLHYFGKKRFALVIRFATVIVIYGNQMQYLLRREQWNIKIVPRVLNVDLISRLFLGNELHSRRLKSSCQFPSSLDYAEQCPKQQVGSVPVQSCV